jgi:hypothetical protein
MDVSGAEATGQTFFTRQLFSPTEAGSKFSSVLQYVPIFVRYEDLPERGCLSRSAFDVAIDLPTFDNPPLIQSTAAGTAALRFGCGFAALGSL